MYRCLSETLWRKLSFKQDNRFCLPEAFPINHWTCKICLYVFCISACVEYLLFSHLLRLVNPFIILSFHIKKKSLDILKCKLWAVSVQMWRLHSSTRNFVWYCKNVIRTGYQGRKSNKEFEYRKNQCFRVLCLHLKYMENYFLTDEL